MENPWQLLSEEIETKPKSGGALRVVKSRTLQWVRGLRVATKTFGVVR